jgi:hypothetical protein
MLGQIGTGTNWPKLGRIGLGQIGLGQIDLYPNELPLTSGS